MEITHWNVFTSPTKEHKGLSLPHLDASKHITLTLMPVDRPLVSDTEPVFKQVARRVFVSTKGLFTTTECV